MVLEHRYPFKYPQIVSLALLNVVTVGYLEILN
jgi:hypothetical protein